MGGGSIANAGLLSVSSSTSLAGDLTSTGTLNQGLSGDVSAVLNGLGSMNLVLSVPEPGTLILGLLGLFVFLHRRR